MSQKPVTMNSAIKYTVVFNYERNGALKKNGTAAVLIRAYLSGRNKYFNTSIYITPKQWHKRNRTIVHHPNQFHFNRDIREEIDKMQRFEYEVMKQSGNISLDRLADYKNEKFDLTFLEFYAQHLEKAKNHLAKSTYTDQRQTFDKLKAFQSSILFCELKPRLINNFIDSLHAEGLGQNTVHKHFKNLKKYINLASCTAYLSPDQQPYVGIKVRKAPTDRLFLLENELKIFEAAAVPQGKEHLQIVKDLFLFSCYTGLRHSDIASIREENIVETPEGYQLFLTSQKTKKPYRQNLRKLFPIAGEVLSRPEQIIKRRLEEQLFTDDAIFVYTNRYSYVKQLKKLAIGLSLRDRIKKDISSHTGRHTFGTVMAGKVSVPILRELMQHSKVRETMIYVHLNRSMIDQALEKVKW